MDTSAPRRFTVTSSWDHRQGAAMSRPSADERRAHRLPLAKRSSPRQNLSGDGPWSFSSSWTGDRRSKGDDARDLAIRGDANLIVASREDLAVCLHQHPGQERHVVVGGHISDVETSAGKALLEGRHVLDHRLAPERPWAV